ncbi:type I-E CRISPR-associated protein Cas6/Cse3/CasE [Aerococcus urinaehominis]|uniref:Type I-E CRISPR-associated protein Cas6/Cse3/CasE n=1 Tax=Aerococcus urinaehominis TaxID=128944 RepID=A0A0X8FMD8_9LACT|nr:type I-E CRISPR-associated protein Cas6/Cse3/CasE [Aerococcus urinaehominis]AMB99973.1 type I-E CRISPR-associated protein Cas6/Cse3/CasE [Aerococcus urinaehominis]SDM45199.1 CRISPR system Cascade subunit CasE [Aerococcus urinaehominis]
MYLSRVKIDTNNRQKIRDLTHVGAYHNWVEQAFPDEMAAGVRSRKLWRIDHVAGQDYLLVVSEQQPDLALLERYGVPGSAETKVYDQFLDQLYDGQKLRFRVTLNPVISKSRAASGQRGRVMPHVTVDHQMNFLKARAEKNGFHLSENEFYIKDSGFVLFKKTGQRDLRLTKVTYEGLLTISDLDQFKTSLTQGFGKKKAYGFGLLTVIPVEQ